MTHFIITIQKTVENFLGDQSIPLPGHDPTGKRKFFFKGKEKQESSERV